MTDNLPTPNIPLLRKAVEWAEAEAAKTDGTCEWDQVAWARKTKCGTSFCIAGYVVMASVPGAVIPNLAFQEEGEWLQLDVNGEPESWPDVAQAQLHITDTEANWLFEANNSITDVRKFAERIAARAGERL